MDINTWWYLFSTATCRRLCYSTNKCHNFVIFLSGLQQDILYRKSYNKNAVGMQCNKHISRFPTKGTLIRLKFVLLSSATIELKYVEWSKETYSVSFHGNNIEHINQWLYLPVKWSWSSKEAQRTANGNWLNQSMPWLILVLLSIGD